MTNANVQRFSQGVGSLTARDLNTFKDSARGVERIAPNVGTAIERTRTPGREVDWFWAKIGSYTSLSSNRWRYVWTEQIWDTSSGNFVDKSGGMTSAGTGVEARNTNECNNGATGTLAPGYAVATLPAGFTYQPIQGSPVVKMQMEVGDEGVIVFLFTLANSVDGACP